MQAAYGHCLENFNRNIFVVSEFDAYLDNGITDNKAKISCGNPTDETGVTSHNAIILNES
jgi:hypothetical protein